MAFGFFFGDSIKILRGKLNLFDNAVLDGTSITASTVIIADANKNIISSNIPASALNSLTAGSNVTLQPTQIAFGSSASAVTSSPSLTFSPTANLLSVSGSYANVGSVTITQVQAASTTLTDNATTQILSVATANFNSLEIHYSVTRGTTREVGMAYVCQSGSSASIAAQQAGIGSPGLTLSSSVISGNLGVSGTLTSTGQNATFSYTYSRWLG